MRRHSRRFAGISDPSLVFPVRHRYSFGQDSSSLSPYTSPVHAQHAPHRRPPLPRRSHPPQDRNTRRRRPSTFLPQRAKLTIHPSLPAPHLPGLPRSSTFTPSFPRAPSLPARRSAVSRAGSLRAKTLPGEFVWAWVVVLQAIGVRGCRA